MKYMKKKSIIGIFVVIIVLLILVIIVISNQKLKNNPTKIDNKGFINPECRVEAQKYQINSYEECQQKSCNDFCNVNRVCCPDYQIKEETLKNGSGLENVPFEMQFLLYEVYPKIDESPLLNFKWVRELKKPSISRITPYGVWEPVGGWSPSYRMQFFTIGGEDSVYAVSNGTIVYLDREEKIIGIRYGTNYGYIMSHVIKMPMGLRKGLTVKQGDILGYTEIIKNEGVWDIQVINIKGNICRTKSPIEFFNEESKTKLQFILDSGTWDYQRSTRKWTVNDGNNWISDLGNDEWWVNCEKMGLKPGTFIETEVNFLESSPISKIMREGYNAVKKLD
jgi:hypothetical protein